MGICKEALKHLLYVSMPLLLPVLVSQRIVAQDQIEASMCDLGITHVESYSETPDAWLKMDVEIAKNSSDN